MKSLKECYCFLKEKKLFVLCTLITLVLSYGFYATHYTVHWDQLIPEYYDGLLLVNAGRWSAALIHFFTGWMDFAPFWHTAVMCLFLLFSAIVWAILFSEASGKKLSEPVLMAFSTVFVSYPVLQAQLTFPVLNIALSYALVPLAIRFVLHGFLEKTNRIKRYLSAVILLVFAVDMYESFAGVFLVGFFAVLLLLFQMNDSFSKQWKQYCCSLLHAIGLLLMAIIIDLVLSKLINLALCGTTEYWYGTNEFIAWFSSSFFTNVKRLLCSVFATYVIGSLSLPFLFFFLFCAAAGTVFFTITAVIKRTVVPVLLFMGLCLSAMALVLIAGYSIKFTQMQTLPVFVAFVSMTLFHQLFAGSKKHLKIIVSCIFIIIVFSQTKTINNYAVENYERFSYESSVLEDVGKDLLKYDTSKKPVAMYAENYELPDCLRHSRNHLHPLVKFWQDLFFPLFDRVLPNGYFERMRRYYYPNIQNTADLSAEIADSFTVYTSYISWAGYTDNYQKIMSRLGYSINTCTDQQMEGISNLLVENDPTCRYKIIETDDLILVQFMTVA